MMPTITGTNGNDNLTGTSGSDTINPLLGRDTVDGLADNDTLIVDYSSASIDPYAGASIANVPSIVSSSGGSFSGAIRTVDDGNYVTFSSIEHLQVKLDFWQNTFILDGGALALGATIVLDGGAGTDTLDANLSALPSVNLQFGAGGTTASFGTIISFEVFRLNLTQGADNVTTGAGNDTLTGNGGDDVLNSGAGNDILSGGTGTNILNAGDGDDWITSSGIDAVDGGSGGFNYDRWMGEYGSSTANLIFLRDRGAGTGSLSNGTTLTNIEQVMYLTTGSGNDVFTFTESEAVTIAAGAGDDTLNLTGYSYAGEVSADGSGAFKGNLGNDRFTGIEHLNFVSDSRPDSITVNAAPILSGATLSLDAAGGLDTLAIDLTAFGSISFNGSAGGTVITNLAATLSNFETYRIDSGAADDNIATGAGDDVIRSNGGNDVIHSAAGNDLLDGGSGADAMTGGSGNDLYMVDDAGDTVTENAGEGIDEIRTGLASYVLGDNLERLTGLSAGGQALTGNGADNLIAGGAGNDLLDGRAGADDMRGGIGNDTYLVDNLSDVVTEFAGQGRDVIYASVSYVLVAGSEVEILSTVSQSATTALQLTGNALGQEIYGNAGDNFIDGGGGADYLIGFAGNDSYVVGTGTFVAETTGQGRDIVYARSDYVLSAGAEVEILSALSQSATSALSLTGNALAQEIYGNAGTNFLEGGGGTDYLTGFGGNDTYVVDGSEDVVTEAAAGGTDLVYARGGYTLSAGAEVEFLSTISQGATTAMALIGNGLDQTIYGNAGANYLEGGGGTDVLIGLGGNDTYVVDSASDYVAESVGRGADVVYAQVSYALASGQEVEMLSTASQAGTGAIDLTGNELANQVLGNAGANMLNGGAGGDFLYGFGGADTFAFTTGLVAGNVDYIGDFVSLDDTIALDDAVFTGLAPGALGANAFVLGTAAGDADDRIIYDQASGQLWFDADGNGTGAAVLFAVLDSHPVIAASDFTVI